MNAMKEALTKAMNNAHHSKVLCPYCGAHAVMVTGEVIYPHRPDLYAKKFWWCAPCDAYVGCHPENPQFGQDGTRPLGRLADKNLRRLKWEAHSLFDPLWKEHGYFVNRKAAYRWLAGQLGIPVVKCHVGFFDTHKCLKAIEVCSIYMKGKQWTSPPPIK